MCEREGPVLEEHPGVREADDEPGGHGRAQCIAPELGLCLKGHEDLLKGVRRVGIDAMHEYCHIPHPGFSSVSPAGLVSSSALSLPTPRSPSNISATTAAWLCHDEPSGIRGCPSSCSPTVVS